MAMGASDAAGYWCRDNATICPEVWWCGTSGYLLSTLIGVCAWLGFFWFHCHVLFPMVSPLLQRWPSTVKDEQEASWFAWHVQSCVHASLVFWMSVGPVYELYNADPQAQLDAPQSAFSVHTAAIRSIANASHVFFCYILVDTLVVFGRRGMTLDYFAHHMVFCGFCVMIQFDCFAPYLAGWLLLQELSTIFLNGFSFLRHRLGSMHLVVKGFFALFAMSFLTTRLAGTTYIAWHFAEQVLRGKVPWVGIPQWHLQALCAALVASIGLQLFWAIGITKKTVRVLTSSAGPPEERAKVT